jgi:ActR/RegA family two-component response regulator
MEPVNSPVREKTVLIVEDREPQRLALQQALKLRGFSAYGAGDVEKARAFARELGEDLDVMVLDMRLDDPQEPDTTGADLGMEVLSAPGGWPPEFLVFSAYSEHVFYNLALKLGAAAYLQKGHDNQAEVIRHIRALALRRGLNPKRQSLSLAIQSIAETSASMSEAVSMLCEGVLGPEFQSCLGAPSAIFVSDSQGTWCCGGDAPIPRCKANIYGILTKLAESNVGSVHPFVINEKILRGHHEDLDGEILSTLDGAALLPLSVGEEVRICLGILKDEKTRLAEDPIELTKILATYLRPAVLEHLFQVLIRWSAEVIRRKALLRATSWAYVSVGQTQRSVLPELADLDVASANAPLSTLYTLSSELVETGEILALIGSSDNSDLPAEEKTEFSRSTQVAEIVRMAMEDLTDELPLDAISVEGDCTMPALREDLYVATLRVLQFFVHRAKEEPQGTLPLIRVECIVDVDRSIVVFEDRSRRISADVRRRLFSPFGSVLLLEDARLSNLHFPLFIAKALVEVKNGGKFEDRSDEIGGELGHRFVISFTSA